MNDAILEQYNVLSNDIKALKVKINFIKDCLQTISQMGCIDYNFSLRPQHYAVVSYTRYELSVSQLRILLLKELQLNQDALAELEKRYADGIR